MISRRIPGLGGSHHVFVDECDGEILDRHHWYAARRGGVIYAAANVLLGDKKTLVYMHRLIRPDIPLIDHHDRNGLNNQRKNLRQSSHRTNAYNSEKKRGSVYKGVILDLDQQRRKKWRARITVDGKEITLGRFFTAEEAARARDEAAIRLHGEFARTNSLDL